MHFLYCENIHSPSYLFYNDDYNDNNSGTTATANNNDDGYEYPLKQQ